MRQVLSAKSLLTVFVLTCCVASVHAQQVVDTVYYDSINDGDGIDRVLTGRPGLPSSTGPDNNLGRSYTGNAMNTRGTGLITRMDFLLSAVQLASYQSIQVNAIFWDSFGGNLGSVFFADQVASSSEAFNVSGPLPSNITFVANSPAGYDVYQVSLVLNTPFSFKDSALNGVTLNIKGNTGAGFFDTNNLTTFRTRSTDGFLVGSSAITPDDGGGYLRNFSGRTDGNFTNTGVSSNNPDISVVTPVNYEALGVRLYNRTVIVVPEANTLTMVALGIMGPIAGLVRRRRK